MSAPSASGDVSPRWARHLARRAALQQEQRCLDELRHHQREVGKVQRVMVRLPEVIPQGVVKLCLHLREGSDLHLEFVSHASESTP